jgi:hypothetical protein
MLTGSGAVGRGIGVCVGGIVTGVPDGDEAVGNGNGACVGGIVTGGCVGGIVTGSGAVGRGTAEGPPRRKMVTESKGASAISEKLTGAAEANTV